MKKLTALISALALSACGDGLNDEPIQYPLPIIEAAEYIADAHCQNLVECGDLEPELLEVCSLLNHAQLCDQFLDCTRDATDEEAAELLLCEADVYVRQCGGFLPDSCLTALGF